MASILSSKTRTQASRRSDEENSRKISSWPLITTVRPEWLNRKAF